LKKKMRIVAFLVAMITLLGMSMYHVAAVTPPDNTGTITGTMYDDTWDVEVGTLDIDAGKEVYMRLVVEDAEEGLDLDLEVWGPGDELIWLAGRGYYWGDDPDIIEEGFFYVPESLTYTIELDGFWIPDENGDPGGSCCFVLYYEVGDNLIDPVAVESSDVTYGELTSYIRTCYVPHMMASDKAAFRAPYGMESDVVINIYRGNWHYGWTLYALPGFVLCADNPIIIGGIDWEGPAWLSSHQEAKQFMEPRGHQYFIEDVETGQVWALSELTNTKSGPVRPVYHAGEKIGYSKVQEHGLFHAGELAELIGTGQKLLHCWFAFDGELVFIRWSYYFWLLPAGAMGPG
jgi:hypothetical protein